MAIANKNSRSSENPRPARSALLQALYVLFVVLFMLAGLPISVSAGSSVTLPPAIGPEEPMVDPILGDDHLYHQSWFNQSFLNLREDYEAAKSEGKRFAVIFEQRGCSYCIKMHKDVLAMKYINDYVRDNFHIVQINLWGDREVTDFDGKVLTEKELVRRWGVVFTPWIVFFKDDLSGLGEKWGPELEVVRMGLGIGPGTFYDMFTWIRVKGFETGEHFQRFHIRRLNERADIARKQSSETPKKLN